MKPGIVLISDRKTSSPREQEVDPGEALGADRPVGVAGDLQDRRALGVGTSARSTVSDRPGVYFAA